MPPAERTTVYGSLVHIYMPPAPRRLKNEQRNRDVAAKKRANTNTPFSHAHGKPISNPDTKPVRSISTRLRSHGQFTFLVDVSVVG